MTEVCPNLPDELDGPPDCDTSRHTCECVCRYCERNGTGIFAQRAALAGDPAALAKLSPKVAQAISAIARDRRKRAA